MLGWLLEQQHFSTFYSHMHQKSRRRRRRKKNGNFHWAKCFEQTDNRNAISLFFISVKISFDFHCRCVLFERGTALIIPSSSFSAFIWMWDAISGMSKIFAWSFVYFMCAAGEDEKESETRLKESVLCTGKVLNLNK